MASTSIAQDQVTGLIEELDALRVFVKALADIAEQQRLKPAMTEYLEEHVHSMKEAGRTPAQIASFVKTFDELRESY